MKFLITGSSGQLAREFVRRFEQGGTDYAAPDESVLDITNSQTVFDTISTYRPQVVLNCAAYNHVDQAEREPEIAFAVNAESIRTLAQACEKYGALLVHFSTDYVFDGTKEAFYVESDRPNPLNVYGQSKLEGERSAQLTDSLILRLSWVFGPGKQNFLYKLLQWAQQHDVLRVVWDQISVPTYTEDVVAYTLESLNVGLRGVYHLTNSDYGSRYEVARYFLKDMGLDRVVIPVGSSHFASPVARPFFSAMSNRALADAIHLEIPTWHDAVSRYVQDITNTTCRATTPKACL